MTLTSFATDLPRRIHLKRRLAVVDAVVALVGALGASTASADEYVVECFWPGVTKTALIRLDARIRTSLDRTGGAPDHVRYLGALLLPTDEVVFCFFDGPSARAVEDVARRAKIPFERVLPSVRVPSARRA